MFHETAQIAAKKRSPNIIHASKVIHSNPLTRPTFSIAKKSCFKQLKIIHATPEQAVCWDLVDNEKLRAKNTNSDNYDNVIQSNNDYE